MLELEGVVKRYESDGERVKAVDGVSLTVERGETVALQGPSGSGKTTLLLLAAALLRPDAGTVRFKGRDLAALDDAQASDYRGRELGFVWQSAQLMPHVSALENAAVKLLLGGMGARAARAQAAPWLERLGLGGRMDHTPERLSGGERRRVAIARALAGSPDLVLADEPTASLDSTRSKEVVALLCELARREGKGVLLVTHDAEMAKLADRTMTLRDGTLRDGAPPDDSRHDAGPPDATMPDQALR